MCSILAETTDKIRPIYVGPTPGHLHSFRVVLAFVIGGPFAAFVVQFLLRGYPQTS